MRRIGSLSRRAAMLAPLAAGGCSLFDGTWLGKEKPPILGMRESINQVSRGVVTDNPRNEQVQIPAISALAEWPQAGGTPTHEAVNAQAGASLGQFWRAGIGTSAGYRRAITGQPVIANGRVFAMDASATVSGFDAATGGRVWSTDVTPEDNNGTNVGGGLAVASGVLYVSTGRGEVLALDPSSGAIKWRAPLDGAARAAPTVAEGRVFVPVLGDRLVAFSATDGKRIWNYQAATAATAALGMASPAYADGLVVAGFGSGELVALRGVSGAVVWADSLASARGRNAVADLSTVRGLPVIQDGRVYATSLGGLMVSLDLRAGRRLWERDMASSQTPVVAGDWIFVISLDAELAAVSRVDGSVAWVTKLPKFADAEKQKDPITWIGPLLAGGRLIAGSSSGLLVTADPVTGNLLAQQDLGNGVAVPMSVAGGTVFVVTNSAYLVALR